MALLARISEEDEDSIQKRIQGILLSRTATKGWLNWLHGELWLFPDGILRLPLGLLKSVLLLGYGYRYRQNRFRTLDLVRREFKRLQQLPHALWIPRETLRKAKLNHTLGADELLLTTRTNNTFQLLWIPNREVWLLLQQTLIDWGIYG